MSDPLIVFPDTNFFIECKVPAECRWKDITDAHEITLLVCRGVRRELDRLKGAAKGRKQERARKVSAQLRNVDVGGSPLVLRESQPRVTLAPAPIVARLTSPPIELDPEHPDDRIICDILAQVAASPNLTPAFLTDDGNAAATGRHVGLQVFYIPDGNGEPAKSWRLPPEPDPTQRRLVELEARVATLTETMPRVEISFHDTHENAIDFCEVQMVRYEPLSCSDIERLVEMVVRRFPCVLSVGSSSSRHSGLRELKHLEDHLTSIAKMYGPTPASKDRYRKDREQWLCDVRNMLANIHEHLTLFDNQFPIVIKVANPGRKPAASLIVSIKGANGVVLCRKLEISGVPERAYVVLPPPPAAPTRDLAYVGPPLDLTHLYAGRSMPQPPREPRTFYWQTSCQDTYHEICMECDEFMHGSEHSTSLRWLASLKAAETGQHSIECVVRAANLPEACTGSLTISLMWTEGDTLAKTTELLAEAFKIIKTKPE